MGILGAIQAKASTGKVVRDYGIISDRSVRGPRRKLSVVLSERDGGRLYIRESWRGFAAFGVNFIELDREEATRFRAVIDDAFGQM